MKRPVLLHSQRQTLVLLDHAHVRIEGTNLVYEVTGATLRRGFNLPWRNIAVLLLGQGTSITQGAMEKLHQEAVLVGFLGEDGAPLMMSSFPDSSQPSPYLLPWVQIWTNPELSLAAVRSFQETRLWCLENLAEKIVPAFDYDQIDGLCDRYRRRLNNAGSLSALAAAETDFTKALHSELAVRWGMRGFVRAPRERHTMTSSGDQRADFVNWAIDQGERLTTGVASLALWISEIPDSMSVARRPGQSGGLAQDLTSAFKDAFVLPLAFSLASRMDISSASVEMKFISRLVDLLNNGWDDQHQKIQDLNGNSLSGKGSDGNLPHVRLGQSTILEAASEHRAIKIAITAIRDAIKKSGIIPPVNSSDQEADPTIEPTQPATGS